MPAQLSRVGVERDDRRGVQVVAFALEAVVVGAGVARAPEREIEIRIVRAGHPDRSAAVLPRLLIGAAPRAEAAVGRTGGRVEAPDLFARLHVVRVDEAADAVLRAGDADDHLVFHHERRRCPAVALLEVDHRRVPLDRAGLAAEGDNVRVERRLEEPIAEHAEAAIDETATRDEAARQIAFVAPDLPARARIDRPSGVERPGHVHHAVEHERRRLELAERVGLKLPCRHEATHVRRRDLRQRTVTPVRVVAAVGEPARRVLQPVAQILRRDLRRRRLLRKDERPRRRGDENRSNR